MGNILNKKTMKKILIIFMAITLTSCGLEGECLTNEGAFGLPGVVLCCVMIAVIIASVVIFFDYCHNTALKKTKRKNSV